MYIVYLYVSLSTVCHYEFHIVYQINTQYQTYIIYGCLFNSSKIRTDLFVGSLSLTHVQTIQLLC